MQCIKSSFWSCCTCKFVVNILFTRNEPNCLTGKIEMINTVIRKEFLLYCLNPNWRKVSWKDSILKGFDMNKSMPDLKAT